MAREKRALNTFRIPEFAGDDSSGSDASSNSAVARAVTLSASSRTGSATRNVASPLCSSPKRFPIPRRSGPRAHLEPRRCPTRCEPPRALVADTPSRMHHEASAPRPRAAERAAREPQSVPGSISITVRWHVVPTSIRSSTPECYLPVADARTSLAFLLRLNAAVRRSPPRCEWTCL